MEATTIVMISLVVIVVADLHHVSSWQCCIVWLLLRWLCLHPGVVELVVESCCCTFFLLLLYELRLVCFSNVVDAFWCFLYAFLLQAKIDWSDGALFLGT